MLFGESEAPPVATEAMKRECLERELRYRRHVYPRRVASGDMTQAAADHQIWLVERILAEGFHPERA